MTWCIDEIENGEALDDSVRVPVPRGQTPKRREPEEEREEAEVSWGAAAQED